MAIPGYRILRKIRQGGMSTVYLAIQQSIDREVAIKVMSPSLNGDGNFGSRFYREAKIVGKLSHPNIVSIYDVGNHKHYNFIAMDYLPGKPLQDRLDNDVTTAEATQVIREMAGALHYAHNRQIVHRDVKPDNILFREDGTSVLCDFGIAKALKGNIKMTSYGAVLGTPYYMSPEQAQGKEIDGRADIYSLGVVFFEMLSGEVPFSGDDSVAIAVKHMTAPIPKLLSKHRQYQPIINQMMAKKVSSRFQTGEEVINALDDIEKSLRQRGSNYLTQSSSATFQIFNLFGALFSTLTTAISISFKRMLLTQLKPSNSAIQISKSQQEELDRFILSDDEDLPEHYNDLPLIQDTIEQPSVGYRWYRLLIPMTVICSGLLMYYLLHQPIQAVKKELIQTTVVENSKVIKAIITEPPLTTPAINIIVKKDTGSTIPPEIHPIINPIHYKLTINTTPANTSIKILNIKPRYQKNMELPTGAYHILVTAAGFHPIRRWLSIDNQHVKKHISLKPTRQLLAAGTLLNDKLLNGELGPKMIVLPPISAQSSKSPVTPTNLATIAIGQFEVTFLEFDQFSSSANHPHPKDQRWGRELRPVININIIEAKKYAQWLSQETGKKYRLPTLAEWQYASQAGAESLYWWGDNNEINRANCRKGCKSKYTRLFSSKTAPVGSYTANSFGVYDTAGNVAEWVDHCQLWVGKDNTTRCKNALIAGGSHQDSISSLGATATKAIAPKQKSKSVGFRLILEL